MREAKAELDRIVRFSEGEHRDFIEGKKRDIAAFHLKNNGFYRNLNPSADFTSWESLPVLTKKSLQIPLQQRLSGGFSAKSIYVNKTSGSSGDPFVFAKDKYSHAMTWASNIYRFGWYGIDFNQSLQARFYGIPLDALGYKKERIKDWLAHRYRFPVFDLSDAVLEQFLGHFRTKKFDYINGYTSSIVLFAKFLKRRQIVLKDICPTLKVCMVTSEMLFDDDKTLLETQFGIPVVNEYGASELDLIAFQNPHVEWQVNAETLFVEILDDAGAVLPYGREGRIVISSLYNTAHPFLRYDIGDIGVLDEKSTLQKPVLKKLTGRTNDIAVLPSGKKSPGLTFYYVTKSIIEDDGNVKEFVITQTKTDAFEIDYVSDKALTPQQITGIEAAIAQYLEPGLHFNFNRKTVLERGSRGKLRQFRSLL
ncbi:AMP-binding protein [Flavobacterium magnum]|uniref:AMP-binding protein n=1 Tax=Flavobacterium magnum TaxID=2162713 RepID=A0A2S0RI19_9FLAO|nr:phenylacetate--CoA ligase family protein [Flavobacterium magnum]AWA31373.1 AMP-binding protein [Flavobacterium magnum]